MNQDLLADKLVTVAKWIAYGIAGCIALSILAVVIIDCCMPFPQ